LGEENGVLLELDTFLLVFIKIETDSIIQCNEKSHENH